MAVLTLHDVTVTFGGTPLLSGVTLAVQPGERLCLMGRNGTGKSTLMRTIAGEVEADNGSIRFLSGATSAYLGQDVPDNLAGPGGTEEPSETNRMLTRLGVDPMAPMEKLSGGALRRLLLARVLAQEPAVLLLDEPTNHLDIASVLWLEEQLERLSTSRSMAIIFVTHDRSFARRLATNVLEVDRGTVYRHDCGYDTFVQRRDERLEQEERQRTAEDALRVKEEAWLRRGVKARRTRDEGRVRRLLAMRDAYRARRQQTGTARLEISTAQRSGDRVITAEDVSFRWKPELPPLFTDFNLELMVGDRLGIVGPNGVGKTTLLRILLEEIEPTTGTIRRGAAVQPVFFDQLRRTLSPEQTVIENLGEGYDTITINNRRRHISAYMQDFLFAPEDANKRVFSLSGGEQNRLLLAKLFARPSNLLILDEPTNDLDSETLELLEDQLLEYPGTIILVSHDRDFLDNVVTDCVVLTGDGTVHEFAGGYSDWRNVIALRPESDSPPRKPSTPRVTRPDRQRKGLSYRQKEELDALPEHIVALEDEVKRIEAELSDPALYKGATADTRPAELSARLEALQEEIAAGYQRWEELEELRGS